MHNLQSYGRTIGELKVDKISGLIIHNNQNKFSKMDEILINTIRGFSPVLKSLVQASSRLIHTVIEQWFR